MAFPVGVRIEQHGRHRRGLQGTGSGPAHPLALAWVPRLPPDYARAAALASARIAEATPGADGPQAKPDLLGSGQGTVPAPSAPSPSRAPAASIWLRRRYTGMAHRLRGREPRGPGRRLAPDP